MTSERAVLAGGCFWGIQDLIRHRPGVISTRVGYTGGRLPKATYRNHGDHAEAIEIIFDPAKTSYRDLLELFETSTKRHATRVAMRIERDGRKEQYTYADVRELAMRVAGFLVSQGIKQSDRVMLVLASFAEAREGIPQQEVYSIDECFL